ncbi:MAG: hypothetical protein ACE5F5_08880 [Acidimicrobiia bacterium]
MRNWIIVGIFVLVAAGSAMGSTQNPQQSPLAEYPGFGHDVARDEALFEEEDLARQGLIRQCMTSKGFDYLVRRTSVLVNGLSPTEVAAALKEFDVDPNVELGMALPTSRQREAFFMAWLGVPDPASEVSAPVFAKPFEELTVAERERAYFDSFGPGCEGDAYRAMPGVYAARQILSVEFSHMLRAIRTDPRVAAAERAWVDCMAENGYDFTDREALDRQLSAQTVTELGSDGVQALLTADDSCSRAWRSTARSVRAELEERFVADYGAILEKYRP